MRRSIKEVIDDVNYHYNIIPKNVLDFNGDFSLEYYDSMAALLIPHDPVTGWPLDLPTPPRFTDATVIVIHTQDFLTIRPDGTPVELDVIEQKYGNRSNQVVVLHWHYGLEKYYKGPINLIYFPSHSVQLFGDLFKRENDWVSNHVIGKRRRTFQCLNGLPRLHRTWVVHDLLFRGLEKKGIVSYADEVPLPTFPYSSYTGTENVDNWMRLQYVYSTCAVNLVTETMYYEPVGIISEKVLFAFLAKQIPVVIGYPGIIDHLEELGFDMFRDIVNTKYDYDDNKERWRNAILYNQNLLSTHLPSQTFVDIKHRLEANFERLREYELHWRWHLANELEKFGKSRQDVIDKLVQA